MARSAVWPPVVAEHAHQRPIAEAIEAAHEPWIRGLDDFVQGMTSLTLGDGGPAVECSDEESVAWQRLEADLFPARADGGFDRSAAADVLIRQVNENLPEAMRLDDDRIRFVVVLATDAAPAEGLRPFAQVGALLRWLRSGEGVEAFESAQYL